MKPLIIGNWKCNPPTLKEAKKLFKGIKIPRNIKADVVICPPFIYLDQIRGGGAQDCFYTDGPYTGQISISMLKNLGCKYVLIGHSEKRAAGDKDKVINLKLKACLEKHLIPVLCIGETLKQRKAHQTSRILRNQLKQDLKGIKDIKRIVIAYEPLWAIGTGKACDPEEAKVAKMMIKKHLRDLCKTDKVKILYGGSVDSKNCMDYEMNGFVIGGASLKAKEFVAILKKFC